MDSPGSIQFDIFEIYRRYCEITSGAYVCGNEGYRQDDESQKGNFSKEALNQLLKLVESGVNTRMSIFDEISKLMSRPDLMVDFSEFSRLYDFVFFICRENGQKNISVSRAVTCWRLILAGRFRLLNRWCNFVEKNQRHNISEDTWRQVLAFSRCVHENLGGYDPEDLVFSTLTSLKYEAYCGTSKDSWAWPVLIDDFVEHMYRIMGYNDNCNLFCSCGDSEAQPFEDPLPGVKIFPGSKRKIPEDFQSHELDSSDKFARLNLVLNSKRRHTFAADKLANQEENLPGNAFDDCMEIVKPNPKAPCAIEGCLSKGFAGLFSGRSCLQFDRERRVS